MANWPLPRLPGPDSISWADSALNTELCEGMNYQEMKNCSTAPPDISFALSAFYKLQNWYTVYFLENKDDRMNLYFAQWM